MKGWPWGLRVNRTARGKDAGWLLLALLVLFSVFSFLDRVVITMLVDPIRADLRLNDVQLSVLLGPAFAIFYAVFGLPMGWLVDRIERRKLIYAGVSVWGLAGAACGLAANFVQLFAARMFVGAFEATLTPAAHSMLSDRFSRSRLTRALSLYAAGIVVGAGLSMILGGAVVHMIEKMGAVALPGLGLVSPWRMVFLATGLPGLILAFAIFLVPEPPRHEYAAQAPDPEPGPQQERDWTMGAFLRARWRLWLSLTLAFGTMNIAFGALLFWQPAYMSRYFHWTPAEYGLALGIIFASGGLGGLLFSGWVIDRLYARGVKDAHFRYFFWALTLTLPFVLYALLSSNVWVYLSLIWLAQFATVNFLGLSTAAVQLTTPGHLRGRMAALFTTVIVSLPGSIIGASLPAAIARYVLHDEVRLGHALAITVALCAAIVLPALIFGFKPLRQAVSEAEAWHRGA